MSQAFAIRLAPFGIRTTKPARREPHQHEPRCLGTYEGVIEDGRLPLGRYRRAEDIAKAVTALATGGVRLHHRRAHLYRWRLAYSGVATRIRELRPRRRTTMRLTRTIRISSVRWHAARRHPRLRPRFRQHDTGRGGSPHRSHPPTARRFLLTWRRSAMSAAMTDGSGCAARARPWLRLSVVAADQRNHSANMQALADTLNESCSNECARWR